MIITESAPDFSGRIMATELAKKGIDSTLITDSALVAMMGRVNKVIIGTHAVMANGGLIAPIGSRMVAEVPYSLVNEYNLLNCRLPKRTLCLY